MNRLRRTFSFRRSKRKPELTDTSKPQQWLDDETKIKEGCCSFQVKYLGNIEVYESRGMQVCEEAIKALRKSKKKPQKAILYVSGDALRVSDDVSQHLIVDQTIEKVSFCAPDRSHDKGFAYICRDGATRRWMCYAFMTLKDSGERLSHAVGCAFAICLEKKQKREQDAFQVSSSATFTDDRNSVRTGSFRPTSLTERLIDPQSALVVNTPNHNSTSNPTVSTSVTVTTPATSSMNGLSTLPELSIPKVTTASASPPSQLAIARPRPSPSMLERQGSLRIFPKLQDTSPFKRDLSLRLEALPSSLQRRTGMLGGGDIILEEPGNELESQMALPWFALAPTRTSPVPNAPAAQPREAAAVVGSHSISLESELSALSFPDPFSSAPVNPATIQQHLQQQLQCQPSTQTRNHLTGLALGSTGNPTAGVSLITNPTIAPPYCFAPTSVFLGGPPMVTTATSSVMTAPMLSHYPASSSSACGSAVPANVTINNHMFSSPSDAPYFPSPVPSYATGAASAYQSPGLAQVPSTLPSWSASPEPNSSLWRSGIPLLLPPEPDRYSDPFDLGWADRTTAVLNQSMRKTGNPFADGQSSSPIPTGGLSSGLSGVQPAVLQAASNCLL